jgi:hypothetical protein
MNALNDYEGFNTVMIDNILDTSSIASSRRWSR